MLCLSLPLTSSLDSFEQSAHKKFKSFTLFLLSQTMLSFQTDFCFGILFFSQPFFSFSQCFSLLLCCLFSSLASFRRITLTIFSNKEKRENGSFSFLLIMQKTLHFNESFLRSLRSSYVNQMWRFSFPSDSPSRSLFAPLVRWNVQQLNKWKKSSADDLLFYLIPLKIQINIDRSSVIFSTSSPVKNVHLMNRCCFPSLLKNRHFTVKRRWKIRVRKRNRGLVIVFNRFLLKPSLRIECHHRTFRSLVEWRLSCSRWKKESSMEIEEVFYDVMED